ncbi:ABC transporter permease DevC [Synechococcus sp. PCC 7336]|uniref:ABC transporter permease DevC n=1 Tax=Synechococcus sp. PCC 7336 TaxID=195250 RepID=UPI0003487848|nr:ABC transporter permease DevC [Synechococcus sp. PCC 7336]
MAQRTPLAWYNLTYERRRLFVALAGVAFAVILMFVFRGFRNALYDSQVQLHKVLNGEIAIVSRIKENMFVPEQFARNRLYQALAYEGIEAAYPVYLEVGAAWKNPETGRTRRLRAIAFNLNDPVLLLPEVKERVEALRMPETVMMDLKARPEVGPKVVGLETELAERRVTVVGTFNLGTDFAAGNGNLLMSDTNFLRYFAIQGPEVENRTLNTVDVGVLKVAPSADVDALVRSLQQGLPPDVTVLSMADFAQREVTYWQENTNIGFVFGLLTAMGFAVGVILVYQILYTDVADHWTEYATLKAIGYNNSFLFGVILQEALLLSVMGYIPGLVASMGLYQLASNATGLIMQMNVSRALGMLLSTFVMCSISGAIALRRVQATDPAEVFG